MMLAGASVLALGNAPAMAAIVFSNSTPYDTINFTVAKTGEYEIDAYGAAAGLQVVAGTGTALPGGPGVGISGDFYLTAGDVLNLYIGGNDAGFGQDSIVSLNDQTLLLDALGGNGGTFGPGTGFNAGSNQDELNLPPPATLPPQYLVEDASGQYSVVGNSAPGLIEMANVPAVPEISTWAMILLGFGVLGSGLRRGRQLGGVIHT